MGSKPLMIIHGGSIVKCARILGHIEICCSHSRFRHYWFTIGIKSVRVNIAHINIRVKQHTVFVKIKWRVSLFLENVLVHGSQSCLILIELMMRSWRFKFTIAAREESFGVDLLRVILCQVFLGFGSQYLVVDPGFGRLRNAQGRSLPLNKLLLLVIFPFGRLWNFHDRLSLCFYRSSHYSHNRHIWDLDIGMESTTHRMPNPFKLIEPRFL